MLIQFRHLSHFHRIAAARLLGAVCVLALACANAPVASAQDRPFWEQNEPPVSRAPARPARRDDSYRPPEDNSGPSGGFGQQAGSDGRPWDGTSRNSSPPQSGGYGGGYSNAPPADPRYSEPPPPQRDYGGDPRYAPQPSGDPRYSDPRYASPPSGDPRYSGQQQADSWRDGGGPVRGNDAYRPPATGGYGNDQQAGYRGGYQGGPAGQPYPGNDGGSGYGQPYSAPQVGTGSDQAYGNNPQGYDDPRGGTYSQHEVVNTGHRFFGSISEGLAKAVERIFRSQGRPNGYILGEDAGGAFIAGLRYGEGTLFTKDVGNHRVYWQGPSLGYDFGGEGSKTMVLVYNLRDPADMYTRFGGVQGSAYLIGGVSVQFQTHEHVTLAVIRSGVGLRLGANVGYLKYTRSPTWNPF